MLSSCDLLSCEHSESMWWTSSGIHHHRPDTALVPFKGAGCPDLTPALWPQWISLIACTWHKLGQGRLFSWMCSGGFKKEHSFLYVAKPYIVSLGNHHCQVPPPPPRPPHWSTGSQSTMREKLEVPRKIWQLSDLYFLFCLTYNWMPFFIDFGCSTLLGFNEAISPIYLC